MPFPEEQMQKQGAGYGYKKINLADATRNSTEASLQHSPRNTPVQTTTIWNQVNRIVIWNQD